MDAALSIAVEALAVSLSLGGALVLAYRKRIGWLMWIVADMIWVWIDVRAGLWSQAGLFAAYTGLAAWGWFKWRATDAKP